MYGTDFRLNDENYDKLSLSHKVVAELVAEYAERKFASGVMDVLWKRNKDKDEWDVNDRCIHREFHKDLECSIHTYYVVERLYTSIFGEMSDDTAKSIEKMGADLAHEHLVRCGWIKEEEGK